MDQFYSQICRVKLRAYFHFSLILFGLIEWATSQFPQIGMLQGISNSLILFGGLILLGVGISVFSTYRSVLKYLKMKLDELY